MIGCESCNEKDYVFFSGHPMPDEVVEKKFKQAGWVIGKNRQSDTCPACNIRAKFRQPAAVPEEAPAVSTPAPTPPLTPFIAPSPLKRLINRRLTEVYDGEKSGYIKGHSDATIAREVDCSPTLVAQIREEFHGSIASNPDMEEFAAKAEALLELQAQIESRLSSALSEYQQIREIQHLLTQVRKVVV
jgi:hypothetical protein